MKHRSAATGIVLLIAGIFLLLGELNVIPAETYHHFLKWPSILILIGLHQFIKQNWLWAATITITGLIFLNPDWMVYRFFETISIWPVILILFGLWIIFKPDRQKKNNRRNPGFNQ